MKNFLFTISLLTGILVCHSCSNEVTEYSTDKEIKFGLIKFENKIMVDSAYTYPEDALYKTWLKSYNTKSYSQTRSLSPEDAAFFNKRYVVKSTEASLLYGRNYIYPGVVLEGNSISDQKYIPIFIQNRKPITVSMTLSHNTPKHTSRTIENPTQSKLDDYVKEMVVDGNFQQNEKFMFQHKRFTFYDEIKSAFGTNIDTRKLFSSRKENSTENRDKIVKSSGMYVKFFQSCFTVNMDIAPLSDQQIKGKTNFEPVYVSSVTYGRMGVFVFETDETYEFAESCIKKEFDRIFYHKSTELNEKERLFFENTEFKILILGADSDYSVQTVKGYSHFLNLIYNSKFTQHSYGVPITCSFSYANSHGLVETEFVNTVYIEPLFVHFEYGKGSYSSGSNGNYNNSRPIYLNFYKDRAKTRTAIPYIDLVFNVRKYENFCRYYPNYERWPMIEANCEDKTKEMQIRNIHFKTEIYVGDQVSYYQSDGPSPGSNNNGRPEPMYAWQADEYFSSYSLQASPFYIIIY